MRKQRSNTGGPRHPTAEGWMVRGAALWAILLGLSTVACSVTLAEIRQLAVEKDLETLSEHLRDERGWVREETTLALGRVGGPQATRLLLGVLTRGDERAYVRAAAARALGRIADPDSFQVLVASLSSDNLSMDLKVALLNAVCRSGPRDEAVRAIAPFVDDDEPIVSAVAAARVHTRCGR